MKDKKLIRYTGPEYLGNPTNVPADRVEAFLARQEELKAMAARGETPGFDAESKAEVKKSIKALREMFGTKQNPQR